MIDTIMTHPRVATALRELAEALQESGEQVGDRFKSAFVVTLHRKSSEIAATGCKCAKCLELISIAAGEAIEIRRQNIKPDSVIKTLAGMH